VCGIETPNARANRRVKLSAWLCADKGKPHENRANHNPRRCQGNKESARNTGTELEQATGESKVSEEVKKACGR